MKRTPALLAALLLASVAFLHAAEVENLRCEYLKAPLGIDVVKPRLSWTLETRNLKLETGTMSEGTRGIKQVAYQVLVASTPELLAKDKGDLWDSGKVESDQSIDIEYKGKALESGMPCFWKVRGWFTVQGSAYAKATADMSAVQGSEWSKKASWVMGVLKPEDPPSPGSSGVTSWSESDMYREKDDANE
jgi:alpha-L-rhamnosidase